MPSRDTRTGIRASTANTIRRYQSDVARQPYDDEVVDGRVSRRRTGFALVMLVVAATGFFVQDNRANSTSRLALTAALAERQTVVIDDYEATLDVDRAEKDGRIYSDKAPGQPFAAVPMWAIYRAVGGDPGTDPRLEGHLGLWWVTLWFAAIPGAILVLLMHHYASALIGAAGPAVPAAIGLFAGTILFPFSTLLFGHVLTATLIMASFLLLRSAKEPGAIRLAGFVAGAAIAVEYTVTLAVVVLLAATAVRFGNRAWSFVFGTVPAVAFLAAYHTIAFGGPFQNPYKFSVFQVHHDSFAGIGVPDPALLVEVLLGERGLLSLTPVVAVALAGLVIGRSQLPTFDLAVPLSILGVYLGFAAGWIDATGGWSPGPRHLLPAIPFLVGGLALAWARWPRLARATAVYSAAVMALAIVTDPQVPDTVPSALRFWLQLAADGDLARTIFSPAIGRAGLAVVLAAIVTASAWLVHVRRVDADGTAAVSRPRPSRVGGP